MKLYGLDNFPSFIYPGEAPGHHQSKDAGSDHIGEGRFQQDGEGALHPVEVVDSIDNEPRCYTEEPLLEKIQAAAKRRQEKSEHDSQNTREN